MKYALKIYNIGNSFLNDVTFKHCSFKVPHQKVL